MSGFSTRKQAHLGASLFSLLNQFLSNSCLKSEVPARSRVEAVVYPFVCEPNNSKTTAQMVTRFYRATKYGQCTKGLPCAAS